MATPCLPDRAARRDALALRAVRGVGDVSSARLLAAHDGPAGALEAALAQAGSAHAGVDGTAARRQADAWMAEADAAGVLVRWSGEAEYPARLLELPDPPPALFLRGALPAADAPAVAIVGTRRPSAYGLRVASAIADRCARAGAAVISGLAQGIDGAAHLAALAAGGRTVAVLGTGIGVHYPRAHRALQERIGREGLLVSELPMADTGHGGTFPRRNRLIAALADVTVVVEAGEGSGALITADHALELGRTVASVPNAIDLPSARGSNALFKQGAEPILDPEDVLALLKVQGRALPAVSLDREAARCWDALREGGGTVAEVAERAGIPVREAAAVLSRLEVDGLVAFDLLGVARPQVPVR